MDNLHEYLEKLSVIDPIIASILDEYREIEAIYNSSLETIGLRFEQQPTTINTADVALSLRNSPSTADGWLTVGNQ